MYWRHSSIYTYMCSTKERSHGTVCSMKNCNGNTLDAKIIEEIRKLSADKETLTRLLAQTKKVISGSKEGYDAELALLREKHTETEDRIKRLVESLSVASDTSAKYVMEQIDELHRESETQQARLSELEAQYGIEEMCADSWKWQSMNPNGYRDAED